MSIFLGIDTSAYTSSLALVDKDQHILADERIILEVKKGNRGLRQSEALFLHIKNLPFLFERVHTLTKNQEIQAIGVSAWPRRLDGSYMPVFMAGHSQARVLSSFWGIPLFEVSHQEVHIMAGIKNEPLLLEKPEFLAVHFSGGTSELLHVKKGKQLFQEIELLSAGSDLHAGQLLDRVGVALGLTFPAGKELETLACASRIFSIPIIPSAVKDRSFSFSGAETRALTLIKEGYPPEDIAFALLRMIANTLEKIVLKEAQRLDIKDILFVGGVMANSLIRKRLRDRLEHPAAGLNLYFAEPSLSTDNAVGAALLASYLSTAE
jgi:N6-L-threonylcarbamoyladenine synthase